MSFEAIVNIQGAGVYVPYKDGSRLAVLFPSSDYANGQGLRDYTQHPEEHTQGFEGKDICDHWAVIQFHSNTVETPEVPQDWPMIREGDSRWSNDLADWTSIDAAGHWIRFDTDRKTELGLGDPPLRGIPLFEDILRSAKLSKYRHVAMNVLSSDREASKRLRGGLRLDRGQIWPHARYHGGVTWERDRNPISIGKSMQYSTSCMRLHLGEVNRLSLCLRPFSGTESRMNLTPRGQRLELWVRHFCKINLPPRPDLIQEHQLSVPDHDFVLNYATLKDLRGLLRKAKSTLPYPKRADSWVGDQPKSDPASQCGKAGGGG